MPKKTPAKVDRVVPSTVENHRRPKTPRSPAASDYPDYEATFHPNDALVAEDAPGVLQPWRLAYPDDTRGLWLYHGDRLEVMDRLHEKHPGGIFDLIFADPPYFLSNVASPATQVRW